MNVHSVSKLSAAVMALAILSYCRQKSHDSAAAPAPASQPKTEAPDATAPASTAPASTAVASTAPASTEPASTEPAIPLPASAMVNVTYLFCQTADEIYAHVTNADHKAEAFCRHNVEQPALSLKDGKAIATDMRLKQGLDVAFLNARKNFWYAQVSCASLGAVWHAPASNNNQAAPRAGDNSNSLEAVAKYFAGAATNGGFMSSSTLAYFPSISWDTGFGSDGTTNTCSPYPKSYADYVVCVRP